MKKVNSLLGVKGAVLARGLKIVLPVALAIWFRKTQTNKQTNKQTKTTTTTHDTDQLYSLLVGTLSITQNKTTIKTSNLVLYVQSTITVILGRTIKTTAKINNKNYMPHE